MKQESKNSFKTRVGGQALIEGVMMRGIDKAAMAVLLPDKSIDVETWEVKAPKKRSLFFRLPFVRGIVNLIADVYKRQAQGVRFPVPAPAAECVPARCLRLRGCGWWSPCCNRTVPDRLRLLGRCAPCRPPGCGG